MKQTILVHSFQQWTDNGRFNLVNKSNRSYWKRVLKIPCLLHICAAPNLMCHTWGLNIKVHRPTFIHNNSALNQSIGLICLRSQTTKISTVQFNLNQPRKFVLLNNVFRFQTFIIFVVNICLLSWLILQTLRFFKSVRPE